MKQIIRYISIALIVIGTILWVFMLLPWYIPLILVVLRALFLLVVSAVPRWNYFVDATHQFYDTSKNELYLTFDDGPTVFTAEILDILKSNKAKATFFCIGKQIEKHPKIFKRIIAEGHTVGNHSYSHSYFIGFFNKKRLQRELELCNLVAQDAANVSLDLYRPPFGICTPILNKVIQHSSYRVVCWSKRSFDTIIANRTTILKRLISSIKPGDVLLLHDTSEKSVAVLKDFFKKEATKPFAFKAIKHDN